MLWCLYITFLRCAVLYCLLSCAMLSAVLYDVPITVQISIRLNPVTWKTCQKGMIWYYNAWIRLRFAESSISWLWNIFDSCGNFLIILMQYWNHFFSHSASPSRPFSFCSLFNLHSCHTLKRTLSLSGCLFVCLFVCLFACLSYCPSVCLTVCLSVCLIVRPSVSLLVSLSVPLSVCLYVFARQFRSEELEMSCNSNRAESDLIKRGLSLSDSAHLDSLCKTAQQGKETWNRQLASYR